METMALLLRQPLSDQPAQLIQEMEEVEAWNARAEFLLAEANSWLDKLAPCYRPKRDEGTDFDRRIILDSHMAEAREIRDKINGLVSSIKQRLILGESILRHMAQFVTPGIQDRR